MRLEEKSSDIDSCIRTLEEEWKDVGCRTLGTIFANFHANLTDEQEKEIVESYGFTIKKHYSITNLNLINVPEGKEIESACILNQSKLVKSANPTWGCVETTNI